MAGTKVNNYSNIDTNIQALQLTTDKVFKGLHQLTLTEMDTTTVPAIAAGSVVECNGTLIKYDTEEAIVTTDPHTSATVADGAVYIVVKGADLTVYFTATAPTWSDAKQGYYGLTTWANDRYVGGVYKSASSYVNKTLVINQGYFFSPRSVVKTHISASSYSTGTGSNNYKIAFDTIDIDSDNNFSTVNNRFTARKKGYYKIFALLQIAGSNDSNPRTLTPYKNGTALQESGKGYQGVPYEADDGYLYAYIWTEFIIELSENDYLEMFINQSVTIPTTIYNTRSTFEITEL